jgi:putative membrane protein
MPINAALRDSRLNSTTAVLGGDPRSRAMNMTSYKTVAALAAGAALAFAVPAQAQPYGPGMMGWGGGYGYGPVHLIFWAVILIGIVGGIVWLVRSLSGRGPAGQEPARRSAGLDVLEERYARGEINRDEYLQKKKDIAG